MRSRYSCRILSLSALMAASVTGAQEVKAPAWIDHPTLPFSIAATEVSVAQFRSCVERGRCAPETVSNECNYGKDGFDDHPVNCVDHSGAEQYCEAIGARLCTGAEWLAACRGTDERPFPYGREFDLEACNSRSPNLSVAGRNGTVPVGSLESCSGGLDGLMDMAGNVAEWIADCKGTYCRFRGGGHLSNDPIRLFASCSPACAGNQETLQSGVVGIRCCRDIPISHP